MSKEATIDVIKIVLRRYAELQVNLASESARAEMSRAIADAIEEHTPGLMGLNELTSVTPHELAEGIWGDAPFGTRRQKKIDDDL